MQRWKEIIKRFLFWIGAAATLLSAGCAKSPIADAAAQKNTEQIVAMAQSGNSSEATASLADAVALRAAYGIPERYTAELSGEGGRLLVHADVEIIVPNAATLPTARVENGRFSQELVSRLFDVLCGDTPMYLFPEEASKERISALIAQCKQELAELETQQGLDASYRAAQTELLTRMLADYEAQYQKAPDKVDLIQTDGTLQARKLPSSDTDGAPSGTLTALDATSAPYDDNAMVFSVNNDAVYERIDVHTSIDEQGNTRVSAPRSGSVLQFHRTGANRQMEPHTGSTYYVCDATAASFTEASPERSILSITPQQARNTVDAFFADAGISDMTIQQIILYSTKQHPQGDSSLPKETPTPDGFPSRTDTGPERQCYAVRCLRQVNGVRTESTEAYTEHGGVDWWYEAMWLNVDDGGISNVYWMAPLNVTKVETENTALIPWQQVREIFEKMFMVSYGFLAKDAGETVAFTLNRVELCLQRINDEGAFTSGLLIPVWNFYGWYTDSDETSTDEMLFPLISINAIDGSVIDVNQGY